MNKGYLDMELLRFTTAGSVDDGKSTLIGRLLYDSKSIFEDQMEAVEEASRRVGNEGVNLALLTDGLRAEREQGITIDVAYRYFATPARKFIIADTPGHIQYTRNMVTGASTADLAIILIDARHGIVEQTIRHSYIASLLGIAQVVVCVNKMDLVDYSKDVFDTLVGQYQLIADRLALCGVKFVPISAKLGDNVVERSSNMGWYSGPTLLDILQSTPILHKLGGEAARLPIQWVIRPINDIHHDFRGYAGRVASGTFGRGDRVRVLPGGSCSTISGIFEASVELDKAYSPLSVSVTLSDAIDVSRGDMLVSADGDQPFVGQNISAMICWFNERPMSLNSRYILRHTGVECPCVVRLIEYRIDINTLEHLDGVSSLSINDIGCIKLRSSRPLVFDSYSKNRTTGSLILVDLATNETVGACMIIDNCV